jgi:hypothetical protein
MSETPAKYGTDNDRDPIRAWLGQVPPDQEPEDVQYFEVRVQGTTLASLLEVAKANNKTPEQMIGQFIGLAVNETEQP